MPARDELITRARARQELLWRRHRYDLEALVPVVSPEFVRPTHLRSLCQALDRSLDEPLMITEEAPPRHAKTETIAHHVVRLLKLNPKARVAYATYSAPLANRKSRRIRELAWNAGVWASGARSRGGRQDPAAAVQYWETPGGGFFMAGGRGGGFVGEGFDLIIIDDPVKNGEEAGSPVIREKVWDLWRGSLMQRLQPGGTVLITQQRWDQDDLIGRIYESETARDWLRLRHPAINDAGEALWPETWPLKELRHIEAHVGNYFWQAEYMQNPIPRGGRLFNEPVRCTEVPRLGIMVAMCCDPACTEDRTNDPSGIVVAAIAGTGDEQQMWVLLVEEEFLEIPALCSRLERHQTRSPETASAPWTAIPLVVEAFGAFKAVPQVLRATNGRLRIYETDDARDKFLRAQPVAAAWNAGRVHIPMGAPWADWFIQRCQRFTGVGGGRKDVVDALAHLWNWCLNTGYGSRRRGRPGPPSAMANSPY